MEEDINVKVMLIDPPEQQGSSVLKIDLYMVWDVLKRFFVLWLTLAVAVGCICTGVGTLRRNTSGAGSAQTLIAYTNADAENGLDPNGNPLDVMAAIASPSVVSRAMDRLGINLSRMESIRSNLKVSGILSDDKYEQLSLLYSVFDARGTAETVRSLLAVPVGASEYIIEFQYKRAGLSKDVGVQLLEEIVKAYRESYDDTYNYKYAMGTAINAINYEDYDYAEAVAIFTDTLATIDQYISRVRAGETTRFRSSRTGYTFENLVTVINRLCQVDLDRVSSLVVESNVTKRDFATAISHYNWLIEELRQSNVGLEAQLASLTEAISAYEKDPVVYTAQTDADTAGAQGDRDYYDNMIAQKLTTQQTISANKRTISYYESVIAGLRSSTTISSATVNKVESYLADLNQQINRLIENVNLTVDDFYSKAILTNTVRVLVPAIAGNASSTRSISTKQVLLIEAGLFVLYVAGSFVLGVLRANPRKRREEAAR